jgi:hypothetical protein
LEEYGRFAGCSEACRNKEALPIDAQISPFLMRQPIDSKACTVIQKQDMNDRTIVGRWRWEQLGSSVAKDDECILVCMYVCTNGDHN